MQPIVVGLGLKFRFSGVRRVLARRFPWTKLSSLTSMSFQRGLLQVLRSQRYHGDLGEGGPGGPYGGSYAEDTGSYSFRS